MVQEFVHPQYVHLVDGRNPFRTTLKPGEAVVCGHFGGIIISGFLRCRSSSIHSSHYQSLGRDESVCDRFACHLSDNSVEGQARMSQQGARGLVDLSFPKQPNTNQKKQTSSLVDLSLSPAEQPNQIIAAFDQ